MSWCGRSSAGPGSTWQNPPASFYRTNRDPMTAAETVAQVFLGIRLQCAPLPQPPLRRLDPGRLLRPGRVLQQYLPQGDQQQPASDDLDKHEINGDEMIYLAGHARACAATFRQAVEAEISRRRAGGCGTGWVSRRKCSRSRWPSWLTKNNRQFSRNLANRVVVSPAGPGHRRAGRRFPRLEPAVQPGPAGVDHRLFRIPRLAAQAAGRLDHEVADLPAQCDARPEQCRR